VLQTPQAIVSMGLAAMATTAATVSIGIEH
jgi:hypothetical protein